MNKWLSSPNKPGYWWFKVSPQDKEPVVVEVYQNLDDKLKYGQDKLYYLRCGIEKPCLVTSLANCLWQYISYPK